MKTNQQIIERIKELEKSNDDLFGFQQADLISALPYELAKEFLKQDTSQDEKSWGEPENPLKKITEYLSFAIGKAEDHRGLSAGRSIEHFRAWTWMLEDWETYNFLSDERNYKNYGAPMLKRIAKHYGLPWPESKEINNMAMGLRCRPDCDEGCG